MQFGLFNSAQSLRDNNPANAARGFFDYVEANVEAEALGYHASFLVEHHFTGLGQVSASLDLQSWVAARTTTLRIGTAVIVLPWHNPVLLAEQAATLDLMSKGRLDLGIGKGYRHNEFKGFRMPMEEAEPRFDEARELMIKAWTSDQRFSHQGRFWSYDDIIVEPQPWQRPHPPLWIAAGNPNSIAKVARLGCNLLLDQFAAPQLVGERIAHYQAELEATGHSFDATRVALARNVFIAESQTELEDARQRQKKAHAHMVALSKRPDGNNRSHIMAYAGDPGATEAHALYGTPDQVVEMLDDLHAVGVRYILLNGGAQMPITIRRFAQHVMPALSSRDAPAPALSSPA